jgi:hypothetical protein
MSTDRELLKLAAKAARYPVRGIAAQMVSYLPEDAPHLVIGNDRGGDSVWNPLTDDGDALRLAVKLGMAVSVCLRMPDGDFTAILGSGIDSEKHKDDPYAATRRAIVRAAAEIGSDLS